MPENSTESSFKKANTDADTNQTPYNSDPGKIANLNCHTLRISGDFDSFSLLS